MTAFDTLVVATHNKGKVSEIAGLLGPYIKTFQSAIELGLPEPEETETTFEGNALLKARSAAKHSGKLSLADDSGLCVNALGGDPGVYAARWAEKEDGSGRDFDMAMGKVHEALGDSDDRSAYFISVLAMVWPDGREEVFEGRVNGQITWQMRGDKGFGYDPIFIPDGYDTTFAEMDATEKQAISHRARAFEKLVAELFS